ncbi:MAG: tRNA lysidine(34) synthetase TilS [Verrucomicrobiales bacterium]|nr:tRNA lysidine(34) synthetase TilS [Verrucomicrobiales bacterium]|tara:strand:+ start:241 stop:1587 length:1347 start_codon:yes stop_codon:yes gene_type:complete
MASLLEQAQAEAASLIPQKSAVLVATSGGMDSMALLFALATASAKYRWRIVAAHFNHRLRGNAAKADQRLVEKFSSQLGVKCATGAWNDKDSDSIKAYGLEKVARDARYSFLKNKATRHRCDYIATGHHASDQAETFLWRLMRGAGGSGLAGIRPVSGMASGNQIKLVRPLLNFSKCDMHSLTDENPIPYREDKSNSSPEYLRNKIRQELIPFLEKNFHPKIEFPICQTQDLLRAEADYAIAQAQAWLKAAKRAPFWKLHLAVQRRVIWQQLIQLGLEPQYFQIEDLRKVPGKKFAINAKELLHRDEQGTLRVGTHPNLEFSPNECLIRPTAKWVERELGNILVRCRVSSKIVQRDGLEAFDADRTGEAIVLRHWRQGDRFQPIGLKKPSKLKSIFTNAKVKAEGKRQRALACSSNGEIFWVQGLRIGEHAKIRAGTQRFLHWEWREM